MSERPSPSSILVIDDDARMRDSLRESLTRRGYEVCICADGATGVSKFQQEHFDVVLCDLRMPGMGGIEVCSRLQSLGCVAPVVVITAFGSLETAVEAMKKGAFDYITKPFKTDELQVVIEKALEHARLLKENQFLRSEIEGGFEHRCLVGRSGVLAGVLELVDRYAHSSATVLIRGESGTGKELVAREIHRRSPRKSRPFVCVNCAALSAGLLESELFGHEKGAFTGADRMRQGRFEIAEGGTLLLDEVSEIEPKLQAKLLRVLQEKTFDRVGSSRSINADVRVLATSNRDLEDEVRSGRFREDLFFRLNVLPMEIPPLRQRKEDLALLVEHFLEKNRRRTGGDSKKLDADALRILQAYSWPGNVRELENVIERAWVLTDGQVIAPAALAGIGAEDGKEVPGSNGSIEEGVHAFASLPLKTVEKLLIEETLRRNRGHQKRTAQELGIGVRTLRSKIKKWNLKDDRGGVSRSRFRPRSASPVLSSEPEGV